VCTHKRDAQFKPLCYTFKRFASFTIIELVGFNIDACRVGLSNKLFLCMAGPKMVEHNPK